MEGRICLLGFEGKHISHDGREALREDASESRTLLRVVEFGIEGVHIDGKPAFTPEVIEGVFEARGDGVGAEAQLPCQHLDEALCIGGCPVHRHRLICKQRRIAPAGLTIGAPIET